MTDGQTHTWTLSIHNPKLLISNQSNQDSALTKLTIFVDMLVDIYLLLVASLRIYKDNSYAPSPVLRHLRSQNITTKKTTENSVCFTKGWRITISLQLLYLGAFGNYLQTIRI